MKISTFTEQLSQLKSLLTKCSIRIPIRTNKQSLVLPQHSVFIDFKKMQTKNLNFSTKPRCTELLRSCINNQVPFSTLHVNQVKQVYENLNRLNQQVFERDPLNRFTCNFRKRTIEQLTQGDLLDIPNQFWQPGVDFENLTQTEEFLIAQIHKYVMEAPFQLTPIFILNLINYLYKLRQYCGQVPEDCSFVDLFSIGFDSKDKKEQMHIREQQLLKKEFVEDSAYLL